MDYTPSTALTAISCTFLALGAVCLLFIAGDIVWRKGWRSMMLIMIPVYPITASYLGPLALYVYMRYGRPTDPRLESHKSAPKPSCHVAKAPAAEPPSSCCHAPSSDLERGDSSDAATEKSTSHCHGKTADRPMLATVLVGVSHCGAGCVLGDLVGEWLVYGTGAKINGAGIWVELPVDYAFALLFGIIFQYFSIAPMSGQWGIKSVWRALKADVLSLTSFQVGLFGWMVAYQVGIFGYSSSTDTWLYWWMMQIGMIIGTATAVPVNWLLLTYKIKEPCC